MTNSAKGLAIQSMMRPTIGWRTCDAIAANARWSGAAGGFDSGLDSSTAVTGWLSAGATSDASAAPVER